MRYVIDTIDKLSLLSIVMNASASPSTRISIEGVLSGYSFQALRGVTNAESPPLHRGTIDPVLDFIVAPLTPRNARTISRAIAKKGTFSSTTGCIVHVQIAVGSDLIFGGYSLFSPENVFCERLSPEFLVDLQRKGVIRGFKAENDA
jgi:hypothetical protein